MNKKFISSFIIISLLMTMLITACSAPNRQIESGESAGISAEDDTGNASESNTNTQTEYNESAITSTTDNTGSAEMSFSVMYLTFEDAARMATDVVIAQYVARRPFNQSMTELEFIVHERIFGNAADRIFVYIPNNANYSVAGTLLSFSDDDRQFTAEGRYLLFLSKIADVFATTHEDGFGFLTDLTLDLNNPADGTIYGEPLAMHAVGINFNSRNLTSEMITSYLIEVTRNNTPAREYIRSENLKDIIDGSPYILVVEITEPRRLHRLGNFGPNEHWRPIDIYYVTITDVLKGDMNVGDQLRVVFFADTVFEGETHLVSIARTNPDGSYFHRLSSRHSLHSMDQLDEIVAMLSGS